MKVELRVIRNCCLSALCLHVKVRCMPGQASYGPFLPDNVEVDPKSNWCPVYLPIYRDPVPVSEGDIVKFEVHRTTFQDGFHPNYEVTGYIWNGKHRFGKFKYFSPHLAAWDSHWFAYDLHNIIMPQINMV
jgi:hypothetical protein